MLGGGTEAGESYAQSFKSGALSMVAKLGVGAAIGKTIASSIKEGAALEQSIGGIETLFKDQAETMIGYAKEAYQTAGVSANEYMTQVTSFSAGLIQSLEGDTKKAGEIANMAMIDMADNANKMGTNMQDIQNAYQGFAKQNYTMLDNLKLGYGGTKTEMERLLADAEKLTGIHYDIENLSDVYSAIHAVQEEIGITGTTALEAKETVSGSFNAMKAAWGNLLGALAMGDGVGEAMQNLGSTIATFLIDNLLPMLGRILAGIPELVAGVISAIVPKIAEGVPQLLTSVGEAVTRMVQAIGEKLPEFLQKGAELMQNLGRGFMENLPTLLTGAVRAMAALLAEIIKAIPKLILGGVKLIGGLAKGLLQGIPTLVAETPNIISAIVKGLLSLVGELGKVGIELMKGLAQGIWNGVKAAVDAAIGAGKKVLGAFTGLFGIHSPSRVMAGYGEMMNLGLAEGMLDSVRPVEKAMGVVKDAATGSFTTSIAANAKSGNTDLGAVVTLLARILEKDQNVYIDGKEAGRLLTPYISKEMAIGL